MASWLSTLLFGKDQGESSTGRQMRAATTRRGQTAQTVEDRYLADDAAFDPGAAFQDYSKGAIANFQQQLGDELGRLKGSSVGAGRLDTGFFDEDQGKVVTDLGSRLQSDLNTRALDVAGMKQNQIAQRGQYAMNASTDYADRLAGELDRETSRDNAKRQQRGAMFGGIGKIAGAAIGKWG